MIHRTVILFLAFLTGAGPLAYGKPDENHRSIRVAALRYLMLKQATFGTERQDYLFYVLRDKEYVSDFPGFNPPVVAYDTNRFSTKPVAVEKKSGKRVKIWSVGEAKLEGDHASVRVSWYSASLAAGWHTVFLKRENGLWIATSERLNMMSRKEPNKSLQATRVAAGRSLSRGSTFSGPGCLILWRSPSMRAERAKLWKQEQTEPTEILKGAGVWAWLDER